MATRLGFGTVNALKLAAGGGSFLAAGLLLAGLVVYAGIDIADLLAGLLAADPLLVLGVIGLTCLNIFLGAEKWRLLAVGTGIATKSDLRRGHCFFYTALGAALGQVLLPHVSTALVRAIGSRLRAGTSVIGSVTTTIFEQLFDMIVACVLLVPTALVILSVVTIGFWPVIATATLAAVGIVVVVTPLPMLAVATVHAAANRLPSFFRIGWTVGEAAHYRAVPRQLLAIMFGLSVVRFLIMGARAILVAWSVALPLDWWVPPVTLPAAQLSALLSLTPGSLGITEWGWSAFISLLGEPMAVASAFALSHRLQGIVGYGVAVMLAAAHLGIQAGSRRCLSTEV